MERLTKAMDKHLAEAVAEPFIEDSALSRKYVAELRRTCLLPQENTTEVSNYMIYTIDNEIPQL